MSAVRRLLLTVVTLTIVGSACGEPGLTLGEYSTEIAELINGIDSRLDARAAALGAEPPDLAATLGYFEARVTEYEELVAAVEAIDPPVQAADLHATLRDLLNRLLAGEKTRADFAATIGSLDDLDQAWEGPEAQAIRAVEQEAIDLCYAAQERVDQTAEPLPEVPWLTGEIKEVVRVAFNCP